MRDLVDQILDYEPDEESPFINRHLYIVARLLACVLLGYDLVVMLSWQLHIGFAGVPGISYYLSVFLPLIAAMYFVYYNLVQVIMEIQHSKVYPKFRTPFIVVLLFVATYFILMNIGPALRGSIRSIGIISCYFIIRRERQYYRFLSKR